MFSSALKSLQSNISNNYSIAPNPSCTCGPWKVYDAKKRSGGKLVSVFVFDRKSIEPQSGFHNRSGGTSMKALHEEIVNRLKKEASSLARLRHPSILELVEPVEETRGGGLTFATEPVTANLAGLLEEKDTQERSGGVAGRGSKYVVEDPETGGRKRREVEVDELEIQKGLLQIGKGLEFLHESAGLVHANLTPEAIFVNGKSDWKISGLGFSTPPQNSTHPTVAPIALSEVLNYDARLPRSVQLNIDYSSPDLIMDSNVTASADMFSLGLIIISLYNSPHRTPLDTNQSTSTYKRLLSSPSSTPTQRNNYLSSQPIPNDVLTGLLPRLITRRPAQRFSAREFQQAQYFDSILMSTLRFLDNLPAKTPNEKSQFLRGLPRMMNQFPKSVLEKKVLPALLEETKDHELLSPILEDVFKIIELVPNGKRVFSEKVVPCLRQIFLTVPSKHSRAQQERDTSKEAGLLVILQNMQAIGDLVSGKDFKDEILPLIYLGLESPTHSIQDASLKTLPVALPILDFSTTKNELFPAVAQVFSKTSSMAIKIRGLEAFNVLCGGNLDSIGENDDSLMVSKPQSKANPSTVLDKYTVQEKIVPLLKGIRTKEPAVMMAALNVFTQVGKVADASYLALDVLPLLWQFSLGPLLNLDQFQEFMSLIKTLSTRVEEEQTRKLRELGTGGTVAGSQWNNKATNGVAEEGDFESLVTGRKSNANANGDSFDGGWDSQSSNQMSNSQQRSRQQVPTPTFTWSTQRTNSTQSISSAAQSQRSQTVTPDHTMSNFTPMNPPKQSSSNGISLQQPLQPRSSTSTTTSPAVDYSSMGSQSNPWAASQSPSYPSLQPQSSAQNPWSSTQSSSAQNPWSTQQQSNLNNSFNNMNIAPPPSKQQRPGPGGFGQTQKSGLDKYDSLL